MPAVDFLVVNLTYRLTDFKITSGTNMDDSIRRVEKLDLEEAEKAEEIEKKDEMEFSPQEERRLVRKLDLWLALCLTSWTSTKKA
jgi:hypothetical protein